MEQHTKTDKGYFHIGYFGRPDYFTPLPNWKRFEQLRSYCYDTDSITLYMSWILDSCFHEHSLLEQVHNVWDDPDWTPSVVLSGDIIAAAMCSDMTPEEAFKKEPELAKEGLKNWNEAFEFYKKIQSTRFQEFYNNAHKRLAGVK